MWIHISVKSVIIKNTPNIVKRPFQFSGCYKYKLLFSSNVGSVYLLGFTVVLYTALVKIMLTLLDYFSSADRRMPWVTD
jgi:hypothetical protein